MAKNTGKRRRHRNRPVRKLKAKHARWAKIMVAPLRNQAGMWRKLREMNFVTVTPMTDEEVLRALDIAVVDA
jgi:hypothetical protein